MRDKTIGLRAGLAAVGALMLAGLFAVPADAAKSSNLEGTFAIKGKIVGDDDPATIGTVVDRTYKFSCADSKCNKVKLNREGANGSHTGSTLKRKSATTYEGVETQMNPICLDGSPAGSRIGNFSFDIVKAKDGVATKIKGELHFKTTGCADDTFQDTTVSGKLK